jgi:hypothetical protein
MKRKLLHYKLYNRNGKAIKSYGVLSEAKRRTGYMQPLFSKSEINNLKFYEHKILDIDNDLFYYCEETQCEIISILGYAKLIKSYLDLKYFLRHQRHQKDVDD